MNEAQRTENPIVVLSPAAVQCPTCKETEVCRTRSGSATKPHVARTRRAAEVSAQMNARSPMARAHDETHQAAIQGEYAAEVTRLRIERDHADALLDDEPCELCGEREQHIRHRGIGHTHTPAGPVSDYVVQVIRDMWAADRWEDVVVREHKAALVEYQSKTCPCGNPASDFMHNPWLAGSHPFGAYPTAPTLRDPGARVTVTAGRYIGTRGWVAASSGPHVTVRRRGGGQLIDVDSTDLELA